MAPPMRVVVLGAGLAGLAAAHDLSRTGARVVVIEKEDRVGGMASSLQVGPWWLDHGPHRFWSRDEELVRHLYDLLDGELVVRERRSRIHLCGRYFDYPLRAGNVVRNLPTGLLLRAARDYLWVRFRNRIRPLPDTSFEHWVVKRFGRTLYELFFGTYTEKTWGMPPSRISAEWASQRISQKSLWEAAVHALRPPRDGEPRGLASEFYYPRRGGIGAIARAYEERILASGGEIVLGARASAIERDGTLVRAVRYRTREGISRIECDQLLSTIPLPVATALLEPGPPESALAAARGLEFLSILFVYLEIDRPSVSPDHWIYLPERHLRVHRVSESKNFSDASAPGDRTALCCEISLRLMRSRTSPCNSSTMTCPSYSIL